MIERDKFTHNLDQFGVLTQQNQMTDGAKNQEDYNTQPDRYEEKQSEPNEEKTVSRRGLRDSVMKQQMLGGNNSCGKNNQMIQELKDIQQEIKFKRQMTNDSNSLNDSQSPRKNIEDYINCQNNESNKFSIANEDLMLSSAKIANIPYTSFTDKQQSHNETNVTADYTTIASEGQSNSIYDGSAQNINNPVNLGILSSGSNISSTNMNQLQSHNQKNISDYAPKIEPFNQDSYPTPSIQGFQTRSKNVSFMHKQIKELLEQEGYVVEESAGLKQLEQLHIIESQRQLVQQASQIYDSSREGSLNQIDDDIQEKDSTLSRGRQKTMRLSLGKELFDSANKKDLQSKNCGNSSPYKNTGPNRNQSDDKISKQNSQEKKFKNINESNENKEQPQSRRYSINYNEDDSTGDNRSLLRKNVFITNAVQKTPLNSNQLGVSNWQQINVESNEERDLLSFHDISDRQMHSKQENEDAEDETSQIEKFFSQQKANRIEKIDLKNQDQSPLSSSSLSGSEVEQRISNFDNYSSKPTCGGGESTRNRSMRMNIGWGGAMKNKNSCEGDDEDDNQSENQNSSKNKNLLNKFKTFSKNGTAEYDSEDTDGKKNIQKINLNFEYDNIWKKNGSYGDDDDEERSDEYKGSQTAKNDNKVFNKFQKYYAQNNFQFDSIEEMESSQESIKKSSTKNSLKVKYPGTTRSLPKTDNPSSFLQYMQHRKSRRQKSNVDYSNDSQQDYEKNDNFSEYIDGVNESIDITVNLDQSQNLKSSFCKSSQSSAKKQPQSSSSFHFNLNQVKMDSLSSPPLIGSYNQENPENNLSNSDLDFRKIGKYDNDNQNSNDQLETCLSNRDKYNVNISNQSNQDSDNQQNNQIQLQNILNNLDQQNFDEIYSSNKNISKIEEPSQQHIQSHNNPQQKYDIPNSFINSQQPQQVNNPIAAINTSIIPKDNNIKTEQPFLSINSVYYPQNKSQNQINTYNLSSHLENNSEQLSTKSNTHITSINPINNQNIQNNTFNLPLNKVGLNKQNLQVHTVNLSLIGNDLKMNISPRLQMLSPTSLGENLSLKSNLNSNLQQNSTIMGNNNFSQNQILSPISSLTNIDNLKTNNICNSPLYQNMNQQSNINNKDQTSSYQEINSKYNSMSQINQNNGFQQNNTPSTVSNHNNALEILKSQIKSNPNFITHTANINLIPYSVPKSTAPSLSHVPQIDSPLMINSKNSRMDDIFTPLNLHNTKQYSNQQNNQNEIKSNIHERFTHVNGLNSPQINTQSFNQMTSPIKEQPIINGQVLNSSQQNYTNPQSFQSTHEMYSPVGMSSYSPLSSYQTASLQNSHKKAYPQKDNLYEDPIKRSAQNLNNNSFISQNSPHKPHSILENNQNSTPISSQLGYQNFSGQGNKNSIPSSINGYQYEQSSPFYDILKNQSSYSSQKQNSVQNINVTSIPQYQYTSESKIQFDSKSPSTSLSQPQIPNFPSAISPFNANIPSLTNSKSNNTQLDSEQERQKNLEQILSVYRNRNQSIATPTVKIDLQKNSSDTPFSPRNNLGQDNNTMYSSLQYQNQFSAQSPTKLLNSDQNPYKSPSQNPSLTNFSQSNNQNFNNVYTDNKNPVNYFNQGSYLMSPTSSYQNLQTTINLSKPTSQNDLGFQEQENVIGYIQPGSKASYTGSMKNNKKNGYGTLIYPDGSTYIGNFLNDQKNGFGQEFDKDKQVIYQGDFQGDKYHGNGIQYNNKSQLSQSKIEYENLSQIQKSWSLYNGLFFQGIKQGKGKMTFLNNDIYDGQFSDDKPYGLGEFTFSNGKTVKGIWENGILKNQ